MKKNKTKFLNLQQSAAFLGVNPGTIRRWAQLGKLKGIKVGPRGDWRFIKEELIKMTKSPIEQSKFTKIKNFLLKNAVAIERQATEDHLTYLGSEFVRIKAVEMYLSKHTHVLKQIAKYIDVDSLERATKVLKKTGGKLAEDAMKDGLTIQEAANGIIFLKQAMWGKIEEEGLLEELSTSEYHQISQVIGRLIDTVSSQVTFVYSSEAEEQARSREEHLYKLFQEAPAFICTLRGKDHVFEMANDLYYQLIGFRDIIGKPAREALPEVVEQGFIDILDNVRKKGKPFIGNEVKVLLQNKKNAPLEERYVNFVYQPIQETDGSYSGIFVHGVDVTDQVRIRHKVEEKEEYYRRYAEAMPQMAFIADAEGGVIYFNKRWYDYIGEVKDTEGWGWKQKSVHHPDDLQRAIERWTHSLRTGEPYEIEYRLKRHDGEYRWHLGRALPFRDSSGNIIHWLGTNTDIHEQKKAEEAVRQQADLLEQSHDAIFVWKLEGGITYWNRGAKELYGFTKEEAIGKRSRGLLRTLHPMPFAQFRKLLEHNNSWEGKLEQRTKDGRKILVESRQVLFYDDQNQAYVMETNRDITEQKRSVDQLRYQKSLLEAQQEVSPLGILVVSSEGKILVYNQRFAEMWKFPQDVIETQQDEVALRAAQEQLVNPKAFLEKVLHSYESQLQNREKLFFKDGRIFDRYGSPVVGDDGVYYGYVWFFQDITERERAEQEIRKGEELTKSILSSLPSYVAVLDKKGIIIAVNEAWTTFAQDNGLSPVEKAGVGVNYLKALEEDQKQYANEAPNVIRGIQQVLQGELPQFSLEFPYHTGPEEQWFLLQATPLAYHGGGAVVSHTDITDRKRVEKDKDTFIGIASHELKTPVTTVKAFAQILQKRLQGRGNKKDEYLLKNINVQADRITNLINDLLDVSKIESGQLEFQKARLDLDGLIRKAIDGFQYTSETHRIVKKGKTSKKVYGDESRLEQVLTNLLTNAIKYSPNADKVIVHLSSDTTKVTVCVQDFGLGIAKQDQKRLFERFYRTDDKEKHKKEGFGLGLYIASEIIKRHDGTIWMESKKGEGSSFCFTLPIGGQDSFEKASRGKKQQESSLSRKK